MKTPLNRLPATRLARMIAAHEVSARPSPIPSSTPCTSTRRMCARLPGSTPSAPSTTAREFDRVDVARAAARTAGGGEGQHRHGRHPSEYGSAIFIGHMPQADAACVAALRSAGAYVFGKTVTAELANFTPGPTRNPRGLEHTPGGSSSGSAAAVASHMAPFAIGTQTAGSVIRPASFCGVVGIRPDAGAVPRSGAKAVSDTLDVVGAFARSVDDVALIAASLALQPQWQHAPANGHAPVIAWTATPWSAQLAPSMLAALERWRRLLASRGARVREIAWPYRAGGQPARLYAPGRRAAHRPALRNRAAARSGAQYRRELLSSRLAALIDEGRGVSARAYVEALQARTPVRRCA